MSSTNIENVKEPELEKENAADAESSKQEQNDENTMTSPQQEEEIIKKKYAGIVPKKRPLISKDHERAFFDSADWALGKQGAQKPKGPLEALRPKLQPTPHQQVRSRRSAYAPSDDEEDGGNNNSPPEDQSCASNGDKSNTPKDQSCSSNDGNNNNNPASEGQSSHQ